MTEPAISDPASPQLARIKQAILSRYPKDKHLKRPLLDKAFADAEYHHSPQLRKSGEPAIIHPYRVALLAAEAGMDIESVIIALLHDIIEDTEFTKAEIETSYGPWLAEVVDGLTKVSTPVRERANPAALATYRKLLSSTIKDLRTLQVKLFDRLDNMRDLGFLNRNQQRRISMETLLMYVPMAQRLGLSDIADELATLCFRYLYPKRFARTLDHLKQRMLAEKKTILGLKKHLETSLAPSGLAGLKVEARYQTLGDLIFSRKPLARALAGFTVCVPTAADCYRALGALHMLHRVVPLSIRDYISNPKPNRYQALESKVFIGGEAVPIAIFSREMALINHQGSLVHWRGGHEELQRYYRSYLELLDQLNQDDDLRMEDVLRYAEMDTLQIFTPTGELRSFPQRASVLDFAFAIHSDLGLHCIGATMDGRWVTPFEELRDGAMVLVFTSEEATPGPEWLNHVRTTRARLALRRHLNTQAMSRAQEVGRRLFAAELKRLGLDPAELLARPAFAQALAARKLSVAQFYQQVGTRRADIRPFLVESGLVERGQVARLEAQKRSLLQRYLKPMFRSAEPDLRIPEFGDEFIQLAACCTPIVGDPVVGVRKEHGIVIHRSECPELVEEEADSLISVGWESDTRKTPHRINLRALDRPGLIYQIGKVMAELKVSIHDIGVERNAGTAELYVKIEPVTNKTYKKIVARLRGIKDIERIADVRGSA
ncbi:MAG: bifunctional (p)ppGpp synthetase/guanosine-3',5'-bis(diphosphate) 3'-pyrophosphohydrolase [Candidatus Lambdaproteobacteria bacterium]|nr:bifunctional (p)ppGpp synthetase/guanosine-3',5'-bis(diphosphate) 3'-pyrophosphohydrolase [Candidatus Lambdaproteobacteria bacterium]